MISSVGGRSMRIMSCCLSRFFLKIRISACMMLHSYSSGSDVAQLAHFGLLFQAIVGCMCGKT